MDADVLIAGLGPVGQLLANLLGARGVRVLCVDPAGGPSSLPRAATTDDEVLRVLQSVGLDSAVAPAMTVMGRVSFVAADGRRLTLLEPGTSPSAANGHPPLAAWHQPAVERVLCAGIARFASVEARWGCGVASIIGSEGSDPLRVRLSDGTVVEVGWVVGCDGARSAVRRLSGIPFGGSTFSQPWLVVDAEVDPGAALPDHVHFVGNPRRPAVTLPMAPGRHRWEFMSAASEDHAALASSASVQALVGADVRVGRRAVYEFHARTAARWRCGRVLLAGDAAHVMPPFAGQGLAAGVRDAANLAWKLAAVLDGAPDALLDTYEAERRPDVRAATRVAIAWGAVLQTRRRRLARARDAVLFGVERTPLAEWLRGQARPRPALRRGVLLRSPGAGTVFPQPALTSGARLDDLLGEGWAVLGAVPDPSRWRTAGVAAPEVEDLAVTAWLRRRRCDWVVVRPDRVVFGTGRRGEEARAARAVAAWLGRSSAAAPAYAGRTVAARRSAGAPRRGASRRT